MENESANTANRELVFSVCEQLGLKLPTERREFASVYLHAVILPDQLSSETPEQIAAMHSDMLASFHHDNRYLLAWVEEHLPEKDAFRQHILMVAEMVDVFYHNCMALVNLVRDAYVAGDEQRDYGEVRSQRQELEEFAAQIRELRGEEDADDGEPFPSPDARHLPKLSD